MSVDASSRAGKRKKKDKQPAPPQQVGAPVPVMGRDEPVTKSRRQPKFLAAGVALVALGGLVGAVVLNRGGETQEVTVLTREVPAGHQITDGDVRVETIPKIDAPLITDGAGVVGQFMTSTQQEGTLLTPSMVNPSLTPPGGQVVVAIPIGAAQMPATLQSGERVMVVVSSSREGQLSEGAPGIGSAWPAQVISIASTTDTQIQVVDVLVSDGDSAALAAVADSGSLVLVRVNPNDDQEVRSGIPTGAPSASSAQASAPQPAPSGGGE